MLCQRGLQTDNPYAAIGRNPAYLQQFVARGSPKRLPEIQLRHLAIVLEVDERELGARDPWTT